MPQCVPVKRLFDICVDYAAVNIDDILRYEEQVAGCPKKLVKLQDLPTSVLHAVSDKVLEAGTLTVDNLRLILNHKTRNILKWNCSEITRQPEFLELLREHCKSVVKFDLSPLLSTDTSSLLTARNHWNVDIETRSTLVGQTLASMVHLEWISLSNCNINDECLRSIGANCGKLKYLDLRYFNDVTSDGIRALCDPSMKPQYGQCTKLTQLNIDGTFNDRVCPEAVCLLLLSCPNLQRLTCFSADRGLAATLSAIDISVAAEVWKSDSDRITLPSDITSLIATNVHEQQVFELKRLDYDYDSAATFRGPFFRALSKYCPAMEDIKLNNYSVLHPGDLNGLFSLPLKSICVSPGNQFNSQPFNRELLSLIQSARMTLNNLTLINFSMFDLRIISRECPNLTALDLTFCDTDLIIANEPENPGNHISPTMFESLTSLTLFRTTISGRNLVNLLSNPNLEILTLHGGSTRLPSNVMAVLQQVLETFPDAFRKLEIVHFNSIEMSISMLSAFLERATALYKINVLHCSHRHGVDLIPFDEEPYLVQLIRTNKWALKYDWSVAEGNLH